MRRLLMLLVSVMLLMGGLNIPQNARAEGTPIGVTAGVEFWNNFFWRGLDFFGSGNGVFFPYLVYSVENTGLSVMYMGTYACELLGDGTRKHDDGREAGLNAYDAAHFNVSYKYTIENVVSVSVAGWYWWWYNSKEFLGYRVDWIEGTVSATVLAIPLSPTLSYTYDQWVDREFTATGECGNNHYLKLAASHTFTFAQGASLGLGASIAYFYWNSMDMQGISDIVLYAKVAASNGSLTAYATVNFAYVPASDFNNNAFTGNVDDKIHWWATFGVSYSL